MYMGFTIYLPSLALNAVTPLRLSWTLALTGGICTFYTAFVSFICCLIFSNIICKKLVVTLLIEICTDPN